MPPWCLSLVQCVAKRSVFFPSRSVCHRQNAAKTSSSRPQSFLNFSTNEDCNRREACVRPRRTSSHQKRNVTSSWEVFRLLARRETKATREGALFELKGTEKSLVVSQAGKEAEQHYHHFVFQGFMDSEAFPLTASPLDLVFGVSHSLTGPGTRYLLGRGSGSADVIWSSPGQPWVCFCYSCEMT